ncbi:MAG: Flp pilus assembly protein CpaB, partial [Candidatus Marinimicrobia bacterium]|nr:Flp pilus assembly protein CpaB [Candidatus Neomarinimicrobiota bacterium]
MTRVLVATTEINPGTRLNEANSIFKEWPANAIPQGAVTSFEQIEERALMAYAIPGEILLQGKFGEKGIYSASNEIPEGMRLATVSVNLTKTHSGLMMPGDHVDLVLTYQGKGNRSRTMTILENVEIFATDSKRTSSRADANSAEIKAKNISLLVTPEQYQICMLAESKGQLTLALRNANDTTLTNTAALEGDYFDDPSAGGGFSNGKTQKVEDFLISVEEDDPEVSVVVAEEPPTWEIKIITLNGVRIEKVMLPEEEKVELPEENNMELPEEESGADLQSSLLGPDESKDQNNLKN